jgi:TfoX N-terminal domain
MFGYPAAFLNGHMLMGLHQEDLILRLPEETRRELLAIKGARVFEPMPGRPMKEYVVTPPRLIADRAALRPWIEKSLAFVESLGPKAAKKKSAPAKKRTR